MENKNKSGIREQFKVLYIVADIKKRRLDWTHSKNESGKAV